METRASIARKLAQQFPEIHQEDAALFAETFFESITAALQRGEEVNLQPLGKFRREDGNPTFRASSSLRKDLQRRRNRNG